MRRLAFCPPACLAAGQELGGEWRNTISSLSFVLASLSFWETWGGIQGPLGGPRCPQDNRGIQDTLDKQNSTLGSEAKNRPLKYLIAFPWGLWLGRRIKLRDWHLEPRRTCT